MTETAQLVEKQSDPQMAQFYADQRRAILAQVKALEHLRGAMLAQVAAIEKISGPKIVITQDGQQ